MILYLLLSQVFLLLQQPGEIEASHPVFVGEQVDHAFAGGAFAAGGHPSVVAGAGLDDALHRPRFPAVEAHLHGDVVAFVSAAGAAEKQDVAVVERQPQDGPLAAVVVRGTIEQFVVLPGLSPALAAVDAAADDLVAGPAVGAGVVVNAAVVHLEQAGLGRAEDGERLARDPRPAAVVAVQRVAVALGKIFPALALVQISAATVLVDRADEDLRWHQESAFVFAVAQRDAVLVHVHGGRVALGVGRDLGGNLFP